MAISKRKKCFMINAEWFAAELNGINDEELGFIVRSIANYVMTGELLEPKTDDRFFLNAFHAVTRQSINMFDCYLEYCGQQSERGKKGGAKKGKGTRFENFDPRPTTSDEIKKLEEQLLTHK